MALDQETAGGWAGFTDKYWLAAVMPAAPDQTLRASYRFANDGGGAAGDRWQVDMATPQPITVAPGATGQMATRVFAGADRPGFFGFFCAIFA